MRKFRRYPMYKLYLEDKVFVNDKLELKIGYLNINDLTAEFHAEYVNADKNLTKLDLLALADTRLGDVCLTNFCMDKLNNFDVLNNFNVSDGIKHMGLLLLLPKGSVLKDQIPEDLIDCFEESKIVQRGPNEGKRLVFVQGNILWIREHYIKVCFLYFREKPSARDLLRVSKYWKGCDLIMGDFNLKPTILEDDKLLKFICGTTHKLALSEMTTVHGQPDHIVLNKRFEMKYHATSFLNFISDHKSFVIRIGLEQNPFDASFLTKINFDSEKHLKKLKGSRTNPTETINEKMEQSEDTEPNTKIPFVYFERLDGSTWLDDTIINEYGKILLKRFQTSVFVFDSHFLEHLSKHGYNGVKRWDKNVNIFEKKFVFYPLFENYHWFLAVQDNDAKLIYLLEPFVPLDEIKHTPKQRNFNSSLRKLRS
jgi:hypothetical protein